MPVPSPTGPAFEGAQISAGQRATAGAIERVRIDRDSGLVRFKVIGVDVWSDDPNFETLVADSGITGICGSGIIEVIGELRLAGVVTADGRMLAGSHSQVRQAGETCEFVLLPATNDQSEIVVTQNDIRQIQLAKAALYAGVKLLMAQYPTPKIDRIEVAGAFGSNIDPQYAMLLGLIPDCDLNAVKAVGNAASTGARIALLNTSARREIEQVVQGITKIETATAPDFQEYFVAAMAIPHRDDEFGHLFSRLPKPPNIESGSEGKRRRRRRRAATDR